jgi:hypothetical protein
VSQSVAISECSFVIPTMQSFGVVHDRLEHPHRAASMACSASQASDYITSDQAVVAVPAVSVADRSHRLAG